MKNYQINFRTKIRKFLYTFICKKSNTKVCIAEKPNRLINLQSFAIRKSQDLSAECLPHRQHHAIGSLGRIKQIIIRPPDRGTRVTVIDRYTCQVFPRRSFPRLSSPRSFFPRQVFSPPVISPIGLFPAKSFPRYVFSPTVFLRGVFPTIFSNNKLYQTKTNQEKPNLNLTQPFIT